MIDLGHRWRIWVIASIAITALSGLGVRLAFLHFGSSHDALRTRILKSRHSEEEILVGRGRILDRNGNILALDLPVKDIFADPKVIIDKGHLQFVVSHLARLLNLNGKILFDRLNRPGKRFVYVKRFVKNDLADEIARLQLTGIHFEDHTARHYPQGALMCHAIGFSNWEGVGSAGIEQKMNRYLKGRSGLRVSERDGRRRELYSRRTLEIKGQTGSDIYLTLDQNIQFMVEEALDRAMETHQPKGAWAIVQRVRTGEILAMVSRPCYDLNGFRNTSAEVRRNRSISYVYEPGSTFKAIVIASALNEGVARSDQLIDCEHGRWIYQRRPLRDFHPYGSLSVADVLKKSSNIGAAKIALSLGKRRLENYIRAFGFGKPNRLNLPGEEAGIFHRYSSWSAISSTRIAMGHEIAVTALQMLNAVCAIANDGFLMRPIVIEKVVDVHGRTVFDPDPEVIARPIRRDTAKEMRYLMHRITERGGTGTRACIDGYDVAGKTGTAQKPVPGGYSDTANIASFVGFAPVENPEIGIIVVVDEPQPLHTGGRVSAPVFKEIAEEVLRYLDVPPGEVKPYLQFVNYENRNTDQKNRAY